MFISFSSQIRPFHVIEKNLEDPSIFMVGNVGGNADKHRSKLMNAGFIGYYFCYYRVFFSIYIDILSLSCFFFFPSFFPFSFFFISTAAKNSIEAKRFLGLWWQSICGFHDQLPLYLSMMAYYSSIRY